MSEEKKIGRPQKVTPNEILEHLKAVEGSTKEELAEIFDVCKQTIGKKLKALREDAEPVFFDDNGYFLLESIENDEDHRRMEKYFKWIIGAMAGVAKCGNPTKPLMIESKKWIKKHLGKDERKNLALYTMQVNRMIDYVNMEEDLED